MKGRCVCGCGKPAAAKHHVVYQQELRVRWRARDPGSWLDAIHSLAALTADRRNLVPVAFRCHERHHSRTSPLPLAVLPDSVFEFAVELMGAGAAFEYLVRRYKGRDPRLDALLADDALRDPPATAAA